MSHAFIVDGVRTAIGNIGGSLSDVRADDLGARVISALMARNSGVDPAAIEDLIWLRQPGRRRQPQCGANVGSAGWAACDGAG